MKAEKLELLDNTIQPIECWIHEKEDSLTFLTENEPIRHTTGWRVAGPIMSIGKGILKQSQKAIKCVVIPQEEYISNPLEMLNHFIENVIGDEWKIKFKEFDDATYYIEITNGKVTFQTPYFPESKDEPIFNKGIFSYPERQGETIFFNEEVKVFLWILANYDKLIEAFINDSKTRKVTDEEMEFIMKSFVCAKDKFTGEINQLPLEYVENFLKNQQNKLLYLDKQTWVEWDRMKITLMERRRGNG